jgi:NAD(P)-dependent dehydrogenase (short-subunit alcohol dehydrogenase family)
MSTRTAVVTGGASGLGAAMSRALADAGHQLVITYRRDAERAGKLVAELTGAGHTAIALPFDLGEPASAELLSADVGERFGGASVLVHNAVVWPAASPAQSKLLVDMGVVDRDPMRHSVEGTLDLTRAMLPGMIETGWGRLIFVSSGIVRSGMRGGVTYAAAKAALHGAARSLAWEVGPSGVTVNVVVPGWIATDRVLNGPDEVRRMVAAETEHVPLGRLASPDEVAAGVAFFASEQASGVSGQELLIDGGRY